MITTIFGLKRVGLVASLFAAMFQSAAAQDWRQLEGDDLCGPTCVAHVAEAYGIDVSLQELIDREQSSPSKLPWSLKDIRDSLADHGVFGKCVRVEDVRTLQWPWPVVLHLHSLPQQAEGSPPGGHFVVLFPEASDRSRSILDGTEWYSLQHVASRASGAAILTAPSHRAFLKEMLPHYGLIALAVLALLALAAFLARSVARKKEQSLSPLSLSVGEERRQHTL
jgi:hypothetical protein